MGAALRSQIETRIEVADGHLRISQPDDNDPDGCDDVILIAPENVEAFIARIRELVPAPEKHHGRSAQRYRAHVARGQQHGS